LHQLGIFEKMQKLLFMHIVFEWRLMLLIEIEKFIIFEIIQVLRFMNLILINIDQICELIMFLRHICEKMHILKIIMKVLCEIFDSEIQGEKFIVIEKILKLTLSQKIEF